MPPITPIYGFGPQRWSGYESLSGPQIQHVPRAMEPGVVVEMAHQIPQPQQVIVNSGLGIYRLSAEPPTPEPPVVASMARYLNTPMMAGTDSKPSLKDAALGVALSSLALVVGVSAVLWIGRELAS